MWKDCIRRQSIELVQLDGTRGAIHRCTHQSCTHYAKTVTEADCAACPLRTISRFKPPGYYEKQLNERDFGQPTIDDDGVITYKRAGWEPPVQPEGYRRKSNDLSSNDAWVFIPLWPPCKYKAETNIVGNCGCIRIFPFCNLEECGHYGKPITVDICKQCPLRVPDREAS